MKVSIHPTTNHLPLYLARDGAVLALYAGGGEWTSSVIGNHRKSFFALVL